MGLCSIGTPIWWEGVRLGQRRWLDGRPSWRGPMNEAVLDPTDLDLLATASYMVGNDAAYAACLERSHQAYLAAGDTRRAVRCAFSVGHNRLFRGDPVQANGGSPGQTGCLATRTASRPATC